MTEATNSTGALLPCPFCGGEARLDQRVTQSLWNSGDAVFSSAACDECDISGQDFCDDPTGEEAIEWWNRRATPPAAAVVPDMDELSNFIRQIDGNNRMGTCVLAERICDWLARLNPAPTLNHPAEPVLAQDERGYQSDHAPLPAQVPYPHSKDVVAIYNSYGPMSLDPHEGEPVEHLYGRDELRDYGARCIAWDRATRPAQSAPTPEPASRTELVIAARKVLDGLNARIDAAVMLGGPVPVFDGIAELHDALSAQREGGDV